MFRHWKYGDDYSQQPYVDIEIYNIIRAKYVEWKNKKQEADMRAMRARSAMSSGKARYRGRRF